MHIIRHGIYQCMLQSGFDLCRIIALRVINKIIQIDPVRHLESVHKSASNTLTKYIQICMKVPSWFLCVM